MSPVYFVEDQLQFWSGTSAELALVRAPILRNSANWHNDPTQPTSSAEQMAEANALNNINPSKQIMWTFGLNFEHLTPVGRPYGCLNLYFRESNVYGVETFVPIDDGGIAIDSCHYTGTTPVSFFQGKMKLEGDQGVCCNTYLAKWVDQWQAHLNANPSLLHPNIDLVALNDALNNFVKTSPHLYEQFTLMAELAYLDGCQENALVAEYTAGLNQHPHIVLSHYPCEAVVLKKGELKLPTQWPQHWWYNIEATGQVDEGHLYYDALSAYQTARWDTGWQGKAEFSTDVAQLFIGYNPHRKWGSLRGLVEAVLIDPADSKPPFKIG